MERVRGPWKAGFTLIELLIVVAIIAILAAIAIPNFLEAQTRAKVSRVKADLRTIATALEAYAADSNDYPPNDGVYNVVPIELTTPVAFIGSAKLVDPFSEKLSNANFGLLATYYSYTRILTLDENLEATNAGRPAPMEGVDGMFLNPGALEKYGKWRLVSNGPDQKYSVSSLDPGNPTRTYWEGLEPIVLGADCAYDPTNGTVSWGNILRTQKDSAGKVNEVNQP